MAQTTTAISSCGAVIYVDNDSDSPINISGAANKSELSFNRQIGSAFTFEGSFPIRISCKKDGSLNITVLYTTALNEALDVLADWYEAGGRRTVTLFPSGENSGERYFSGEFLIQDLTIPLDVSSPDPVMVTATLVPDGQISFLNVA